MCLLSFTIMIYTNNILKIKVETTIYTLPPETNFSFHVVL